MHLIFGALLAFILQLCAAVNPPETTLTSGPSEPTLTVHQAAITPSCITSLIATDLSCWPITAPALAVRTPGPQIDPGVLAADVEKREEPHRPEAISCVQLYSTTSTCAIGVHLQPSFGGYPTDPITITTTQTADAAPTTSVVSMSVGMSVEILDGTLENTSGTTWRVSWTDEVRDRIISIANDYCGLPATAKRELDPRQGAGGAMAPGAIDRITCDMRTLEEGQQAAFQAQVAEVVQDVAVEMPAAAAEAFAATGMTTLQIQQFGSGAIALVVTGLIAQGYGLIGLFAPFRKDDILGAVPKVTARPTPTTPSTTSSSSSSSSTSRGCPLCTGCAPVALNDDQGQIGMSIPTLVPNNPVTTSSITTSSTTTEAITSTAGYKCVNGAAPHETITHNQGPWCNCPEGAYVTGGAIRVSGNPVINIKPSIIVIEDCAYTTSPPETLTWKPRDYDLPHVSCDVHTGQSFGMVKDDLAAAVTSFCSDASAKGWWADAHNPYWSRYPPTVNALLDAPGPAPTVFTPTLFTPLQAPSFPGVAKKDYRIKVALQVRYDRSYCDDPSDPTAVGFWNKVWCEDWLEKLYDQCKSLWCAE